MTKQPSITRSTGNVFSDLGFDAAEAQLMLMRTDLMIELEKTIAQRGLTQAAAGKLLGVSQARISDLIRRKADRFSLDMLVTFAARLGRPAKLTVGRAVRKVQ
jgi:predicted XRE-type DNA-binding protein